ncbi:MAG: hypothetical protein RLZZ231_934 [Bacteroidota bacterium]|jgi:hypothetical protein
MKISKNTLIYIYALALCLMTFLLAKRTITSFKTNEFDYFKLVANFILIVYFIIKIVKLGKEQNDQGNSSIK